MTSYCARAATPIAAPTAGRLIRRKVTIGHRRANLVNDLTAETSSLVMSSSPHLAEQVVVRRQGEAGGATSDPDSALPRCQVDQEKTGAAQIEALVDRHARRQGHE